MSYHIKQTDGTTVPTSLSSKSIRINNLIVKTDDKGLTTLQTHGPWKGDILELAKILQQICEVGDE